MININEWNPDFLMVIGILLGIGLIRLIASKIKLKNLKAQKDQPSVELFNTYYEKMDDWGMEGAPQPEIVAQILKKTGYFSYNLAERYKIKKLSAVISTLKKRGLEIEPVKRNNKVEGYKLKKK